MVSISPLKEGKKYAYFGNFPEFKAQLPADSTSKQDFQYNFGDPQNGWTVEQRYYSKDERWVSIAYWQI